MTRVTEQVIAALVADARPVRRLWPPARRMAGYLAFAAAVLAVLVLARGLRPDLAEQLQAPLFALGVAGGLLTGAAGTLAALMLATPDRSRYWIALPLPALALWLGAVGVGCLTFWVPIRPGVITPAELANCFATVVLAGTPLSLGMLWLLRRAVPLRPGMPLAAAALAASGMSSAALSLLHSIDPSVMILLWNGFILALFGLAHALAARMLPPAIA